MKIPTTEEVNPAIAPLLKEEQELNVRKATMVADNAVIRERLLSGTARPGNAEENRLRSALGKPLLQEELSDEDQFKKNRDSTEIVSARLNTIRASIRHEKDRASAKICELVAEEHASLVGDLARCLSALHTGHLRYIKFLESIDDVGASTGRLSPVWPPAFGNPRHKSSGYFYAFQEMRDNGHIRSNDIPKELR